MLATGDGGQDAAARLVALARQGGPAGEPVLLATAESLTGGLVGSLICSVPGASVVYRGGVIAYATEVKAATLEVSAELLAERGAVDPDVAMAMARGAAKTCGAHYGVATTGVAGPDPADGKPVGQVYLAVAGEAGSCVLEKNYEGDRAAIRAQAAADAVQLLLDFLAEGAQ